MRTSAARGRKFDGRERAALTWAESVTLVAQAVKTDHQYAKARAAFEQRGLVGLTITISLTNAFNRMFIRLCKTPLAALSA
ncbi:hypothetical protein [Pandoraea fibrosis]|uniref:Alkylhydroperoxidase n=1 Tax=Pandoraea fibrosis TaxID=1891094 RepID=A0A5E4SIG4_9BURK|nr:hypothetical protein [Pandoraea fibrosis]VVD75075.1 alkylhydroperoxidase [Pandoraea fibrosis]